jgi:nucleoside-diphosphate-sugar epimerase
LEHHGSVSILLTGCAGFIGSNVADLLLREGRQVVGVDNLNNASDPELKTWRLARLQRYPGFSFHRVDISARDLLMPLFVAAAPSAVINLAARAGVRQSVNDPWACYETNVLGTLNLLELCRTHGVSKFVLASSSSVYGEVEGPFRESGPSGRPLSPYAASKEAAEVLCGSYHALHRLDVSVLRYFTVYGPAGRPDMSIFRFVRSIVEGEPLTIYGDGQQERDFTYVEDIASGTVRALRPLGYEVINLGSDRPVRVLDVVRMLEHLLERRAVLRHELAHPADVRATWAEIFKARDFLSWEPATSLEHGLQRTASWYQEHRSWAQYLRLD